MHKLSTAVPQLSGVLHRLRLRHFVTKTYA